MKEKIELISVNKIKLNPNNPRFIKDDKFKSLVKSIRDTPRMLDIRPIIVNDDMIIIGGNMRYKACLELGYKDVPIIIAKGLTQEEQNAITIKDNIGYGEWDWDMLANEWDIDELNEWGLDIPELNKITEEIERDDLSDKIKSDFRIEIICKNEQEQEIAYNKLIEQGYECRLLTL